MRDDGAQFVDRQGSAVAIRLLSRQDILVSAGHTNASLDILRAACDAGLRMFTHLGNGCPRQLDRHDNILQRAFALRERLWICFIADGVHVPLYALRNYLDLCGVDRCIVVTDAMAAAGMGPGVYELGRWTVEVGEDLAAWAPQKSHLLGSAVTMRQSVINLKSIGLSDDDIRRLTVLNPMTAVGIH